MVVWGTDGRQVDLGVMEHRRCDTCGTVRPFHAMLAYRRFHLYWIFRCVTKRTYSLSCEVCQNGWELARKDVEGARGPSPIPTADRYGLAVLAGIAAVVVIAGAVMAPASAARDVNGSIATEGVIDAFEIREGDCFNDQRGTTPDEEIELERVAAVPCSVPHDNEVYAVVHLEEPSFPGPEEMAALAANLCFARFDAFVGKAYEESVLDIFNLYPSKESWTRRGDREVVCALYHMNAEKLEGTARNSGL
jgi:hypothetical protein